MKLNKKRKIIIVVTLIVIALALFTIYTLKSGSEKFAILDLKSVTSINDPVLKTAIKATEECNKLETDYKKDCYYNIAWEIGYNNKNDCEKLKEELKSSCYFGYGRQIAKQLQTEGRFNKTTVLEECSKTEFENECFSGNILIAGEESAKTLESEQCKKCNKENRPKCYEGIGRQLAIDNKTQEFCKKVEEKEMCLKGYALIIDSEFKRRNEALQICNQLNEESAKQCYFSIGENSVRSYKKLIKDVFKECEQYKYTEECKHGAAAGVANKFFEENQQKNEETASVTTPAMFAIYRIKNIVSIIKQKIIPHFINYKLIYLTIILSASGIIIIISVLKNKKVQKVIKRLCEGIRTTTQKVYYISIKKLFIIYNFSTEIILQIYKELKVIIQDVLSIDKTTITSFSKELKTELGSKEGKKRL